MLNSAQISQPQIPVKPERTDAFEVGLRSALLGRANNDGTLCYTSGVGPFSFNYNRSSSYLTDPSLSRYSKVDGYGLTDASVGIRTADNKFEVSLLAKNLFNVDYGYQPVWNLYIPGTDRWLGVTVSGKL